MGGPSTQFMGHSMMALWRKVMSHAAAAWWWLRQVSGDAAYENYLRSAGRIAALGAGDPGIRSRRDFYLDALRRRYSGVSRCC